MTNSLTKTDQMLAPAQAASADTTIIDARPSKKSFALEDILCLTTGLMLSREGSSALHRLVAFMMEEEATARNTAINAQTARKCIEEQLPFLKDIAVSSLYSIYAYKSGVNNPYLDVWRDMQALRYGAEHYLVPLSRWQKRANSHKLPPAPANPYIANTNTVSAQN